MAKMNLSIPDDLREQMKQFDNSINWSFEAANAFRTAVRNAEYIASIKSAVKRRIVQTEIEDLGGVEKAAHRDGMKWATDHARMGQLKRLQRYVERDGGVEDFGTWENLVRVILGDQFDEGRDDWLGPRSQFGDTVVEGYEEQCANAFAEGALQVFSAIERDA